MKLSFYGADREVTGSCHGVEANGKSILVDCGMFQGSGSENVSKFPFNPIDVDCVVMTHAHIDHSGKLPLLVREGFKGKIFATGATCDLLKIMLRDSAHIQEMDAEWRNKKSKRSGEEDIEPLYTMKDAEDVFQYLMPCKYNEEVEIEEGVKIRFIDAGHLLGSASIEMWLTEGGITQKVVFSGDIGNLGQPIIRDPQYIKEADYVIMESTYGDENHEVSPDYVADLASVIDKTLAKGGNVVIPSFAIGRTQELLYFIREMKEKKLVKSVPDFPVYVDSPLALAATKIYEGDIDGYVDEETLETIRGGRKPLNFTNLHVVESTDESKALNGDLTPKVIISASGMCDAGRIRHHLKHNLWRSECSVVFVGFQAKGSLGRIILDQEVRKVKLFGEEIAIACGVYNFRGLSAHADRDGLLKWAQSFASKPQKIFVVHGESEVCDIFAGALEDRGISAYVPKYTAVYDLISKEVLFEGVTEASRREIMPIKHESPAYLRLVSAGKRLLEVITQNRGGANKDLAKFTDQIAALIKKWER